MPSFDEEVNIGEDSKYGCNQTHASCMNRLFAPIVLGDRGSHNLDLLVLFTIARVGQQQRRSRRHRSLLALSSVKAEPQ